jgi:hypothetical protein
MTQLRFCFVGPSASKCTSATAIVNSWHILMFKDGPILRSVSTIPIPSPYRVRVQADTYIAGSLKHPALVLFNNVHVPTIPNGLY